MGEEDGFPCLVAFVESMSFLGAMSGQIMIAMGFDKLHPHLKVFEVDYYSQGASNGSFNALLG